MNADKDLSAAFQAARESAEDTALEPLRYQVAKFTAEAFTAVGLDLYRLGLELGPDSTTDDCASTRGGNEIIGVSILLGIASQLTSASSQLFSDGRRYAAAALLRQLVEVEYLAWAFQTRDRDAKRWLECSSEERESFFKPAKLRSASAGKFRSEDYHWHCEFGGHPVPRAWFVLQKENGVAQFFLSDLLGHTGRIWDHIRSWGDSDPRTSSIVADVGDALIRLYAMWKDADKITKLPPQK